MKLRNLISAVPLLVVLLTACQQICNAQGNTSNQSTSFKKSVLSKTIGSRPLYNDEGILIPSFVAQQCIAAFSEEMPKHGIDTVEKRTNINIKKTRKITTETVFAGEKLMAWLAQTIAQLDPTGGDSVGIKLVFGIYTPEALKILLSKYGNMSEQWKKRENRITVFIVPYNKNTGKSIDRIRIVPSSPLIYINLPSSSISHVKKLPASSQDLFYYDLGGLHP